MPNTRKMVFSGYIIQLGRFLDIVRGLRGPVGQGRPPFIFLVHPAGGAIAYLYASLVPGACLSAAVPRSTRLRTPRTFPAPPPFTSRPFLGGLYSRAFR